MKPFKITNSKLNVSQTGTSDGSTRPGNKMSLFIAFTVVLLLACGADYIFNSQITVDVQKDCVVFRGGLVGEPIYFNDIKELEFMRDDFELGERVSGISALGYHAGKFTGGSLECTYDVFLEKNWEGPFLIITHDGGTMVVGVSSYDMEILHKKLSRVLSQGC